MLGFKVKTILVNTENVADTKFLSQSKQFCCNARLQAMLLTKPYRVLSNQPMKHHYLSCMHLIRIKIAKQITGHMAKLTDR